MFRAKRTLQVVTLAAVGCLAMSACQSASKANGGGSSSAAGGDFKVIKTASCPSDATETLAKGATIKVGLSYPLSGAQAASGVVASGIKSALEKQNAEKGGVDGHKIEIISSDDAYDATRAVSNVTRFVQSDKVMLINQAGTPMSVASQPIAEKSCTPQLFLPVSADTFVDPASHPFTTAAVMTANNETGLWLQYLQTKFPNGAKIAAVAYDNDFGKGFVADLTKQIAGTKYTIVSTQYHATTAVTLDTEAATAVAAKPDVVVGVEGSPFCAKLLSGLAKSGYTGAKILASNCIDVDVNFKPLGEPANGTLVFSPFKGLSGPDAASDSAIKEFQTDMSKYGDGAPANSLTSVGYTMGSFIIATLEGSK